MSAAHPIIGITGSSGAGTSTAVRVFARIFEQLEVKAAMIEGDAFHAVDREQNKAAIARSHIRGENFSLFGPAGNLLGRLEQLLANYGARGQGVTRHYLHSEEDALAHGHAVGTFTPWEKLPAGTDMLFYEGLHGGYVDAEIDIARHMDLLIGVVPVINLEWIQKLKRDTGERGARAEDVTQTILRRMPDYVNHIVPQFSRTDVNFQRVPLVDTSNPFVVRDIPGPQESLVVVHFNEQSRVGFDAKTFIERIDGAFQSHERTLVVPGPAMEAAMELVARPAIEQL
ncbi:MAG TPA: phosphoribulokinase, partial [Nevskiaceae bacterium]|nr:phosphoribulokinase [Nevskiaceae bacterium]